jgi:hypothetical protein
VVVAVFMSVANVPPFTTEVPPASVPVVLTANVPAGFVYENADNPRRSSVVVPVTAPVLPEPTLRLPPVTASDPLRKVFVTWFEPPIVKASDDTDCDCPPKSTSVESWVAAAPADWRVSEPVESGLEEPSVTVALLMMVLPE